MSVNDYSAIKTSKKQPTLKGPLVSSLRVAANRGLTVIISGVSINTDD